MTGRTLGPVGSAYMDVVERVGDLTYGLDAAAEKTVVPACPHWSIHDATAHLAGIVADVMARRLKGVATDAWTEAQVEARRHLRVSEIIRAKEVAGRQLRVEPDGGEAAGPDNADLVLRGTPFEIMRAITGRRSVAQLRKLDWHGDYEALLPAFTFGPFRPAERDIVE